MSVLVERDSGLVRITFDNPRRRNALTPQGFDELRQALEETARSTTDRAVLITGSGGSFCSGADLSQAAPAGVSPLRLMGGIHDAARALHRLPQPVVAAVDGPAFGAGMSIALGCDLVIASETATFCQVFVKRGLAPDFGSSWLLPRLVGLHVAKRLVLLGDVVTADEARDLGLVHQVVPADRVLAVGEELARRLADGPPIAIALAKRLLHAATDLGFEDALDAEAAGAAVTAGSEDTKEAFAAFAEKRAPVFRGV
jgi:2-(1,2-epoxy-1,2-dihydrophenyl)acetyl-CoA isomerase